MVRVPPGTIDRLQPLDVSTNKPDKDFLREKFRTWYAEQLRKQLEASIVETAMNVNMGMAIMKEVGAQWLTGLYDKLCNKPEIIVNGFKMLGLLKQ